MWAPKLQYSSTRRPSSRAVTRSWGRALLTGISACIRETAGSHLLLAQENKEDISPETKSLRILTLTFQLQSSEINCCCSRPPHWGHLGEHAEQNKIDSQSQNYNTAAEGPSKSETSKALGTGGDQERSQTKGDEGTDGTKCEGLTFKYCFWEWRTDQISTKNSNNNNRTDGQPLGTDSHLQLGVRWVGILPMSVHYQK